MIKVLFETKQDFIDYLKRNPSLLETKIEENESPLSYPVILVYEKEYLGIFIYLSDFDDPGLRA